MAIVSLSIPLKRYVFPHHTTQPDFTCHRPAGSEFTVGPGFSAAQRPWRAPTVIAYRGDQINAVENTIEAFRLAQLSGATAIELDVQLSSDNVVVVHHDTNLGRVIEGKGAIADKTFEELSDLGIPSLKEVFRKFPDMGYFIDFKASDDRLIRQVVHLVAQYGNRDEIAFRGDYGYIDCHRVWWVPPALADKIRWYNPRSHELIENIKKSGRTPVALVKENNSKTMENLARAGIDAIWSAHIETAVRSLIK